MEKPGGSQRDSGAGDRFDDLEIEIGAYFTFVMDDPSPVLGQFAQMFGMSEDDMRTHPHALFGSVDAICEELNRRRELHGISYITIGKDNMEAFAPVVERAAINNEPIPPSGGQFARGRMIVFSIR